MSFVTVSDKRGGIFRVAITFGYGECDRLPYNQLRKVGAQIEQVARGGIKATAEFNLRNARDAANFVTVLDMFGEEGSFVHGSPADPSVLVREEPPADEDAAASRAPRAEADDIEVDAEEMVVEERTGR